MQRLGSISFLVLAIACGGEDETANNDRGSGGGSGSGSGSGGTAGNSGSAGTNGGGGAGGSSGAGQGGSPTTPSRDPLPCFNDMGTDAGDAISISVTANRLGGVAPLAVFFDTDGTTADATDRPYHELGFCWDFGDPMSGNFATTGLSKNQAKGPVTGHVFEEAGTYAVKVSARDAQGRVSTVELSIEVEDPDAVYSGANTVCFSGEGEFTGCPDGAAQVTTSALSGLQEHVATGRRLLLRRGEVFSGDGILNINVPGPGTIGAFGEGERPSIQPQDGAYDESEPVIHLSDDRNASFNDWRLMDVAIDEPNFNGLIAISPSANAKDFLMLRVLFHGMAAGINAGIDAVDYWVNEGNPGDIFDGMFIQDSELREIDQYALYVATRRFLYLGNVVADSRSDVRNSLMRLHWLDRAVISNSIFGPGQCEGSHLLYIPGPYFTQQEGTQPSLGNGQYGRRILLSDNVFRPGTLLNWSFYLGAQNTDSDERFRDVLIERNLFLPGGDAHQASIAIRGDIQNATIRENLFNQPRGQCVAVHPWKHRDDTSQPEFVPTNLDFIHNTCLDTDGALAYLDNTSPMTSVEYTSVRLINNLVAGDGADVTQGAGASMIQPGPGNLQFGSASEAGLTSGNPMEWEDFNPTAGSAVVDAADPTTWSPWDYSGRPRAVGSGPDTGALEYNPE